VIELDEGNKFKRSDLSHLAHRKEFDKIHKDLTHLFDKDRSMASIPKKNQ